MSSPERRTSDRWVTPGVIVAGLLVIGVVLLALIGVTAWLTREGIDISPMLQLMREWVTTVAAIGALVLQLANRSSVTKTERNTGLQAAQLGHLAGAMYDVADAMPRPVPRHSADPYPPTVEAPAPRGS